MSDEFKLPGSSFQEVGKIVQGYASLGKPSSLADVSKAIGMDTTIISRNAGFLVCIGILEAGRDKAPTSLGMSLGNALMHEQAEEVKRLLGEVVAGNEFLKSIVSAIRIRKGMDDSALRSHIAYSAGAKKGGGTTVGAGAVIEMLQTSGAISSEDGKYVVVSGATLASPLSGEVKEREIVRQKITPTTVGSETTELIKASANSVTVPTGSSDIKININIDVKCDSGDLDTLGKKLRQIINDLNNQVDTLNSDDKADAEDAAD
jgi:hypothetical protein